MRLDNFIQTAMNNVLKKPVLSVLRDINFSSILKQSNFIKEILENHHTYNFTFFIYVYH